MVKNSMKPQIRFKGFTDAWEQRKFGELYRKVSRKNDLTYGETDIISVANMYYKVDSYITDSSYLLTYNVFHLGDIAFEGNKSKDFAHGRFVENTIGNGIVSHVFDVFEPIMASYDLMFWKYAINNERLMGPILVRSTKASTMMTNLVADDFLQEKFMLPSFGEQKLIGQLLFQVDNLITLHQRKYEKFVNIKKALLEKMFPQGDEKVPRIRFKGFTDAWEQRKFGDVFDYERPDRYIVVNDKYNDNFKTPVLTANKGFILGYTNEDRTYDKPCVIFDDFTLDCKFVDFKFMVKSSALKILTAKTGNILRFAYERLNSSKIENLGHARHYISVVQPTETTMPTYDEQKRIAILFEQLDNLITLHQRQVEKLKNIKSALLEKMFV